MPESNTIAASAPRSSARIHSVMRLRAGLLLALDDDAHVDRQLALARELEAAYSSGQKLPLSSDAPRA